MSHKPTVKKTKERTLNDKELSALTLKWEKQKPANLMARDEVIKRVKNDLDQAKKELSERVPKKVYQNLMDSYTKMRVFSLRKSHLKDDLKKSLVVDNFLNIDNEDNLVIKAYKKVKGLFDGLFNEDDSLIKGGGKGNLTKKK